MGLLSCGFLKAPLNQHRARSIFLSALVLGHGVTFIALPTSSCGLWEVNHTSTTGANQLYNEWRLNSTLDADNYVQNCYFGSEGIGVFDCETLVSQSLPFSVSHDVDCPFESHVCRTDSAFAMDTRNISLAQLGINSKELFYFETITSEDRSWLKGDENMTIYKFDTGLNIPENGTVRYLIQRRPPLGNTPLRLSDELTTGYHGPSIVLLSGRGITFPEQSDDPLWSVHTEVKYGNGILAGVNLDEAPRAY
ncbi:hypothetical protein ACJZ2D_010309 [Fusarium nematophilum]